MQITEDMISKELARLHEVRQSMISEVQQMTGAIRQLEKLLEALDLPEENRQQEA